MSGQRKYSMELRERATRMALEARADPERRRGAIKRISGQLGINPEALRTWVRAVEQGGRNERGEVSDQEARIRALEAENRELRRANEILKAASASFWVELGRLGPSFTISSTAIDIGGESSQSALSCPSQGCGLLPVVITPLGRAPCRRAACATRRSQT